MSRWKSLTGTLKKNLFWIVSRTALWGYRRVPIFGPLRASLGVIRNAEHVLVIRRNDGRGVCFPGGLSLPWEPDEKTLIREIEEETGYRVGAVQKLFSAFMSPGALTEKLHFFIAEYDARPGQGGGLKEEGEDIEGREMPFDKAYAMIATGEIADAKTIMLLQYARLNLFVA